MSIIEIKNLKRDFQVGEETVHALRGISFSIEPGEFVSIMGTSGSGKSTLLNILGCLDSPTAGDYIIDGTNVASLSSNELADIRNRKIGFVFQSYNLLPRTSVLENVELPLMYNKTYSARQRHDKAMEVIQRVGLEQRIHHTSAQLSGGQQQRVAIARALVGDPVIILADEATGNLDTRTSYEIMALFHCLRHPRARHRRIHQPHHQAARWPYHRRLPRATRLGPSRPRRPAPIRRLLNT